MCMMSEQVRNAQKKYFQVKPIDRGSEKADEADSAMQL